MDLPFTWVGIVASIFVEYGMPFSVESISYCGRFGEDPVGSKA